MLTPLEPWIAEKIGLSPTTPLTREALGGYQLSRLRATVEHARTRSPFYRERLAGVSAEDINSLDDVSRIPFTTPADVLADDLAFLCVSQAQIERVVTLFSSGTTSAAKRLHFTAEDLELTVDFFHHGMSTLVGPGERVLILMPGELPGSVGDLLQQGLARLGSRAVQYGIVTDERDAIAQIVQREIDCLVGLPVQVLGLARHPDAAAIPAGRIKSVLLSADYVPAAIVEEIERVWDVPVYNHYGMTEMGLGGAVDCGRRCGGHLREADLYVEIVDPATGAPVPEGEEGELVFTTLTRTGMPLIRYRSGDISRLIPEPCPCGTVLKRLAWVSGRVSGAVQLAGGGHVNVTDLDETLFPMPELLNYQATLTSRDGRDELGVDLFARTEDPKALCRSARQVLEAAPLLREAIAAGSLVIGSVGVAPENWSSSGSIKRTLRDLRETTSC